ncbi:MAG: 3-deoxy-8-phosphooctulonate synthase [Gemmatimonadales bacterium]
MTRWRFRSEGRPVVIAGPCVIEDDGLMLRVAEKLASLGDALGIPMCFKASFDKANRSRAEAARGPGLDAGLASLARVRRDSGLPVLTDVHETGQVAAAADAVDVLQVPAFLCRQTDLLLAVGRTGKPINLKKGQWADAGAMAGAVEKVRRAGADEVAVTERGTFFGYGDLVVDFRNVGRLREAAGAPVLFDATHSVQRPGRGVSGASGGDRDQIPALIRAAAAVGVDGFFIETHPDPARAASDADTQWPLDRLETLLRQTLEVWHAARART